MQDTCLTRPRLSFSFGGSLCFFALLGLLSLFPQTLSAQVQFFNRSQELEVSLDTYTPWLGSELGEVVRPNLGFSFAYRYNYSSIWAQQLNTSYIQFRSRQAHALNAYPLYTSLLYRLPTNGRLDTYLKLGLGSVYLEVQPDDKKGWNPLAHLGFELSIPLLEVARIGVHMDMLFIYEKSANIAEQSPVSVNPDAGVDDRLLGNEELSLQNALLLRFGLLYSYRFLMLYNFATASSWKSRSKIENVYTKYSFTP